MKSILRVFTLLAVTVGAVSCSRDTTAPVDPVAGAYAATTFITTTGSGPSIDQLRAGSSVALSLDVDHTMSGQLHLAASGSNPAEDTDMVGTWTRIGDVIDFSQPLDSFMRDMIFLVDKSPSGAVTLIGDQVISGTRIQLTLAHITLAAD